MSQRVFFSGKSFMTMQLPSYRVKCALSQQGIPIAHLIDELSIAPPK